jgi:hypothetical protein
LTTLRKYKNDGVFLTSEEIYQHMPNKIIEFYTANSNMTVKKIKPPTFWADEHLETFKTFILEKCKASTTPDLKFKELMTTFTRLTNIEATYKWSAKYETIFNNLNIKYERVIDPKFSHSTGTFHLYLKFKNIKKLKAVTQLTPVL